MYENYTKQSLASKEYRELLGTALYVFNSNNSFMIENILREDETQDWYSLIDKESGKLRVIVNKSISKVSGNNLIEELFFYIVNMRNRIIHGFPVTSDTGEQILATKTLKKDGNEQFIIDKEYLEKFIEKNAKLSKLLHEFRGD